MDLKQLQYFVVSVDCGSFKKAAELLYTTQPHISKTIKSLEDDLGCALLERNIKGVTATDVGKNIYSYARQVLIDSNRIINLPEELYESKLKVAANSGDRMVSLFSHYLIDHKDMEMRAEYIKGSLTEIINSVSSRETDIGFLFVSERQSAYAERLFEKEDVSFYPLLLTKPLLFVGPKSPFYNAKSVTDQNLRGCKFIQSREDDYAVSMNPGFMQAEYPFYKNQQVITTNSEHLLIHMLLDSTLCNISYNLPSDICVNEKLHAIPIEGKGYSVRFGYILRNDGKPVEMIRDFIEYVKRNIQKS